MPSHAITPAVGAVCRCKAKAGLRRSPRGLHTRTRLSSLLRLNLDSSLKTTWFHSAAIQFPRDPLQTEASMGGRQWQHT
ncbi:e3 ubiquitin-protein ligase RNF13 [Trichonephila clavipes]|nr:e3 ubiquitin-protein ligase RNF13 [Trichonephila clavipes]